jgi:hypothetical protein
MRDEQQLKNCVATSKYMLARFLLMNKCTCANRQICWSDKRLPTTRMESCQALQGFLLNQNPDYVARIAVVSPAGSLLTLAPALSAHRYFRKKKQELTPALTSKVPVV